ncbi:MAG: putative bifunctional diguanylate cyclase/phosphodiesterase [Spirochaetota bacterium]
MTDRQPDNTYRFIVNRSQDFITLISRDYRYEFVNAAYSRSIGLPVEEILEKTVEELWGTERFRAVIKDKLDEAFAGNEVHFVDRFRFGVENKDLHVSFFPYGGDQTDITHVLVFSHDISRLKEVESRLETYEYRDRVTGLFNRRALYRILQTELDRAKRSSEDELRALLFISLKSFKQINRKFGAEIGDLLLEHSANRLLETLRSADMVFRFEGSNLVVLLNRLSRSTDVALVAQKLYDSVAVPYSYRGEVIAVSAYIGIALYPLDATEPEDLIRLGNSASVEAEDRRQPFLLYDSSLHAESVRRMTVASELRRAFTREEWVIHYQPIVRIEGSETRVIGAEALVRWQHPTRGLLEPPDFIEIAEDSGLLVLVDKWALYRVCLQLVKWKELGLFVSVNLSAGLLNDEYILDVVEGALRESGCECGDTLRLELTENRAMQDPQRGIQRMKDLAEMGIQTWIDDFGTGHSSLSYLKYLPAQTIKIDQSFTRDLVDSEEERTYFRSLVASIRARGKEVIVEGVDTAELAAILVDLGCPLMQGFHFGHAQEPEGLESLV